MVAGVPTRLVSPAADGSTASLGPDCCQMAEPSEQKALQGVEKCYEQTTGHVMASRELPLKLLDWECDLYRAEGRHAGTQS